MNKIEKFRTELEKYEEKYALLIKEHIQEEINKIDSSIEISIYGNDIDRIYVTYKEFKFEFTYYYSITSRKLCFRGYGKTNTHGYSYDRYTREEQKERERAYGYVRSILKSVLEDNQNRGGMKMYVIKYDRDIYAGTYNDMDGCYLVEEKANEMIVMIRECSNIRNLF